MKEYNEAHGSKLNKQQYLAHLFKLEFPSFIEPNDLACSSSASSNKNNDGKASAYAELTSVASGAMKKSSRSHRQLFSNVLCLLEKVSNHLSYVEYQIGSLKKDVSNIRESFVLELRNFHEKETADEESLNSSLSSAWSTRMEDEEIPNVNKVISESSKEKSSKEFNMVGSNINNEAGILIY